MSLSLLSLFHSDPRLCNPISTTSGVGCELASVNPHHWYYQGSEAVCHVYNPVSPLKTKIQRLPTFSALNVESMTHLMRVMHTIVLVLVFLSLFKRNPA